MDLALAKHSSDMDSPVCRVDNEEIHSWTHGDIERYADCAATIARYILGVDKKCASDLLIGQMESMKPGLTSLNPCEFIPTIDVNIGEYHLSHEAIKLTPSYVVNAHDRLTHSRNGDRAYPTSVLSQMYMNRTSRWWNTTMPDGAPSRLAHAPLKLVLVRKDMLGLGDTWKDQKESLKEITELKDAHVAEEGLSVSGYIMLDSHAILGGIERPDGYNRFPQFTSDRGNTCGPRANILLGQLQLAATYGEPLSDRGFRTMIGSA